MLMKKQSTTILSKIKPLYDVAVHFFAPVTCAGCRSILLSQGQRSLCAKCFNELPVWNLNVVASPVLPRYVDGFDAPYLYDGVVKDLITSMKFSDKPEYAHSLASLMKAKFHEIYREGVLVLPVPMHRTRLQKRMFNQSSELVKALRCFSYFEYDLTGFRRVRSTKPQVGQSAKLRKQNLKDAFDVLIDVKDKSILLIDDVWTTGSTADACAKCLKAAGANEVRVLTAAYVEKPTK